MKLQEFIKTLQLDVEAFETYWTDNHKTEPFAYPKELSGGTWIAEFIHYCEKYRT